MTNTPRVASQMLPAHPVGGKTDRWGVLVHVLWDRALA